MVEGQAGSESIHKCLSIIHSPCVPKASEDRRGKHDGQLGQGNEERVENLIGHNRLDPELRRVVSGNLLGEKRKV